MKIEHNKKPPIYDKCVEIFGVNWESGVIFTYGDTIYCKYDLSPNKLAHEMVHVRQQNGSPEAWWDRYFNDESFRLAQELEAYKEENKILNKMKDRNAVFKIKSENAKCLSSGMYGNIISYSEAMRLLK